VNTGLRRVYGPDEWRNVAFNLCRGVYQRHLVWGGERLDGGLLRGKARTYKSRYQASAAALLDRLKALGVPHVVNEKSRLVFMKGRVR
jgi:hypothetical protein